VLSLRTRDWGRLIDITLAGALLALGIVEVLIASPSSSFSQSGPAWLNVLFLAGMSVPALWRRTRPAEAFAASTIAYTVYAIDLYPAGTTMPLTAWLSLLVMTLSLALYANRRDLLVATLFGVACLLSTSVRQIAHGTGFGEAAGSWLFPVGAWLIGRALHRRDMTARRLRRMAEELELARAEQTRQAVVSERARIARELHDVISHSVSVIVMQAAVERRLIGEESPRYEQTLREIEHAGRNALGELRALLGVLRDDDSESQLEPQPGLDQLPLLIERVRGAGLPVSLRVEGDAVTVAPGIELSAYRVVQEGLTNVLKHADASTAEVLVRYAPDHLDVEVHDDGAGSDEVQRGSGLIGLRERASLYGGTVETRSGSGKGFLLRASLPIAPEAA
jgi:signal transduction histidine kinase